MQMTYSICFEHIDLECEKEMTAESLKFLIDNYLAKNLDISNLKKIIFTSTFKETVLRIQKENNLRLGVTENNAGIAYGKTIEIEDNYIVIVDSDVLNMCISLIKYISSDKNIVDLPSDVKKTIFRIINVMHHELCHVHDNNVNKVFHQMLSTYCQQRENLHAQYSNACIFWSEYIVNYLSASTIPQEANYNFGDILFQYENLSPLVKESKERYFIKNDSLEFFNEIVLLVAQFVNFCCYTLGILSAEVNDSQKRTEIIYGNLSNSFSVEYILKLDDELHRLHLEYPNWKNVHVLRKLSDISLDVSSIFGVHIFQEYEGYRFEID